MPASNKRKCMRRKPLFKQWGSKVPAKGFCAAMVINLSLLAFAFPATPVNPASTPDVANVLNYLVQVRNSHKILSGIQSEDYNGAGDELICARHMFDLTGKWPALIGLDFYHIKTPHRPKTQQAAIDYYRAGGLVTLMWHEPNPNGGNAWQGMSQADFDQMLIPGTALYNKWVIAMDSIAPYLIALRDSGIVVLWRPYHEMNGGWFWWGAKGGASFNKLWANMYDRFTNYYHLNNLLWVWGPFNPVDAAYYPAQYCDIGGFDFYTGNKFDGAWVGQNNALASIMGSKPYAITESGLLPDPTLIQSQTSFSFFLVWGEQWCDNQAYGYPSQNGPGNAPVDITGYYSHPACITRDEIVMTPMTEDPVIIPAGGHVNECAKSVAISCATSGAAIYYTTDGSDPSAVSSVYTAPLTISASTNLKAVAIKSGLANSSVVSAQYVFTTGNIALSKTISVSSTETSGNVASNAVDGQLNTRWASILAPAGAEWVVVDLGGPRDINYVGINWEAAYAKSYRIQTSADNSTWTDKYGTTTGTGGIVSIVLTPVNTRYVRVLMTERGSTYGYSIWELEIGAPNICTGLNPAPNPRVPGSNKPTSAQKVYDMQGRRIMPNSPGYSNSCNDRRMGIAGNRTGNNAMIIIKGDGK
jgi:hypothetical protein